ncbi:VOC family protein [Rhodococcus sp. NPDC056960]|uniref:VOC family protein n=1 Tax=Rhodococcus sp. NPDC056960 TaxID=3345982 RepID=UPI0036414822
MTSTAETSPQSTDRSSFFRARRLGHVNLFQTNAGAVSAFYREVAGVGLHYHKGDRGYFHTNGNTYHDIGLMEAGGEGQSRLNHLAFELATESDLVYGYDEAVSNGVKFTKTASHDVAHAIYLKDPDGNGVEVYADIESNWRELRSGNVDEKPHKVDWKPGDNVPLKEARFPVNPDLLPVDGAIFPTKRISAATLVARDFSAMLDFYTTVVGLVPIHGTVESPYVVLAGATGEAALTLVHEATGRSAGLHHFSWEVESVADLDTALPQLAAAGHDVVADVEWRGRRSVFVNDPNGFLMQFYADQRPIADELVALHDDLALFVL